MGEEIYIPYGQDSIAQNQLMTKLADGVQNYVNRQSWSSNRKQMFLNAYSDIMSKGIVGASNDTGQWTLNLKNNIDLNSKSQKEQDMYHEAAYFILNQMKGVTPKAKEEEKKKSDIKPYDNAAHTKGFEAYVANTLFGGRNWDLNTDWDDAYDPIDSKTGLRPTTNRALKLADLLEGYSNSLKPEDMNFESTPFKDINDLKGRFSNAVNQLRDGTFDQNDKEALNQLGLDWKKYLSDGSDDQITLEDGTVTTRGAYAEALRKQEADKLATEQAAAKQKAIAEQKAKQGVLNLVSGVHAVDARNNPQGYQEFLADTYGVGQQGFNTINTEIQKLLNKYQNGLTNREKRQLGNFLYYIRQNNPNYKQTNLTDQEWAELNTHENLKSKNRNGFVRLPWKTQDGRYTYADDQGNVYFMKPSNHGQYANPIPFVKGAAYNQYKNQFLSGTARGTASAKDKYLNTPKGLTESDYYELTGIGMDIASIIDPEPFSAGGLGLGAALSRNIARNKQPGSKTFGEHIWQGVDYLTGAIGAIPILGDAVVAGKTAAKAAKIVKRILTIPAIYDTVSNTPGAAEATKKLLSGNFSQMTRNDWMSLGSWIRGLTGVGHITKQNRAQRGVLEKRGYDLSEQNSWLKKSGLIDTAVPTSKTTVKVNVKGKGEQQIEISASSKKKLNEDLKKAGNDQAAKDKAIRKVKEVQEYKTAQKIKDTDISAVESSSIRNNRFFGQKFGILPKWARTTKANYGNNEIAIQPTKEDVFDSYLEQRGTWDKLWRGSNRMWRRFDPGAAPVITAQQAQQH